MLEFVHDFLLWSALGAKKNSARALMCIVTQGLSFMPLYWKRIHFGLMDLVRQVGNPKFFWTFALHEWSTPYHEFVLDEMPRRYTSLICWFRSQKEFYWGSIRMTRDGTNGEAIYSIQKMVSCIRFCAWNFKMEREWNQHKTTTVEAGSTYIFLALLTRQPCWRFHGIQ